MMASLSPAAPAIAIVGWKNSGKTTLVERLVARFSEMNLRVATIKHAHHSFSIDRPQTDSARHRAAGARQIMIISDRRIARITELGPDDPKPTLEGALRSVDACDLIIIEGFKRSSIPKIEVRGPVVAQSRASPLAPHDDTIIAIAGEEEQAASGLPFFKRSEIEQIAAFIAATLGLEAHARD